MAVSKHVVAVSKRIKGLRKRAISTYSATASAISRMNPPDDYRPGVTIVTVNWNSLPFLRLMLTAVQACSPADAEIFVVDNGSSDGSREFLSTQKGVRSRLLPFNVGHGPALDMVIPSIDTEYVAILDVDAFPISRDWLDLSVDALSSGVQISGARMWRNYVHPCFLVARTEVLHKNRLTFRAVGRTTPRIFNPAPLFLDVGESLSQRVITKYGGSSALHYFERTDSLAGGSAGSVFADIVYHNFYATQGIGHGTALDLFNRSFEKFHPDLVEEEICGSD